LDHPRKKKRKTMSGKSEVIERIELADEGWAIGTGRTHCLTPPSMPTWLLAPPKTRSFGK
jgi:hypothetical protein